MTTLSGLKIFSINPADGSFISGVEETSLLMSPTGTNYMVIDSNDYIYVTMKDINGKFMIVSI
jgi:hypothetical protein